MLVIFPKAHGDHSPRFTDHLSRVEGTTVRKLVLLTPVTCFKHPPHTHRCYQGYWFCPQSLVSPFLQRKRRLLEKNTPGRQALAKEGAGGVEKASTGEDRGSLEWGWRAPVPGGAPSLSGQELSSSTQIYMVYTHSSNCLDKLENFSHPK